MNAGSRQLEAWERQLSRLQHEIEMVTPEGVYPPKLEFFVRCAAEEAQKELVRVSAGEGFPA